MATVTIVYSFKMPEEIKQMRKFTEMEDMDEWRVSATTQFIHFRKTETIHMKFKEEEV